MASDDDGVISFCHERTRAADVGLLALRLGAGGLLAGHGAQKLFGSFGGHGLEGTAGWLESIGMRPGKVWAGMAGMSEFAGGALMALGLGGPLGPITLQGAMATAARKVHWGKPIWATEGGAEVPMLYGLIGVATALAGPGRYSLDRVIGLRVPKTITALAVAGVAAGIALTERQPEAAESEQPASAESEQQTSAETEQPASDESTLAASDGAEDRVAVTSEPLVADATQSTDLDSPAYPVGDERLMDAN
jgi:putative oxidoreductase